MLFSQHMPNTYSSISKLICYLLSAFMYIFI